MTPFSIAFHHATRHGVLSAVHLPDSKEPVPDEVLARLHPEEAAHARGLTGYRQVEFVGGRLALSSACAQLGATPVPVLPDHRGTPTLGDELVGSVSHKRTLAVGMVARPGAGSLGVDLEDLDPPRMGVMDRVLTPAEAAEVRALAEDRQWLALLVRFSIKEAIYKALDPYVRRYVGFHEAEVRPDVEGDAEVRLLLANGEGPFLVDARYEWLRGRVLSSVRIRPASGDSTAPTAPAASPPTDPTRPN